jgi:hypothetical protein
MALEDKEAFLARWSRRKRKQAREEAAPLVARAQDERAPAPLPPVEELTPQSDFAPFMQPQVAQALRRVALKKLFLDPHFNIPDAYEPFSGDWTGGEPISQELLGTLNQARTVLFREEEERKRKDAAESVAAEEKPKEGDGTGQQDT